MGQRTFTYRIKRWPIILCLPVGVVFVYFYFRKVVGPADSIVFFRVLKLEGPWATAFYVLCLLFSIGLLATLLYGLFASFVTDRAIELRADRIRMSKSAFSSRTVDVLYRDIRVLEVLNAGRHRILRVTYVGGKVAISTAALPLKSDFDYIVRVLAERSGVSPGALSVA